MGALFRLPAVQREPEEFLAWAREHRVRILVTAADGEPLEAGPRPPRRRVAPRGGGGRKRRRRRGRGARGRRRPAAGHTAGAGCRVAQRGGRGGDLPLRGDACRLSSSGLEAVSIGFAALFGAVFGSFLNVCILRWGAEPKQSVHASRRPAARAAATRSAGTRTSRSSPGWRSGVAAPVAAIRSLRCTPRSSSRRHCSGPARWRCWDRRSRRSKLAVASTILVGHRRERRPRLHHSARALPRRHRDRARLRRISRRRRACCRPYTARCSARG